MCWQVSVGLLWFRYWRWTAKVLSSFVHSGTRLVSKSLTSFFCLFVLHLHYDTIIYRLKIIQQININQSCEDSRLSLLDLSFSAFIYLVFFLGSEKSVPTAQFTAAYILSSLPAYFLVQVRWQLDFYIKIWTGVGLPDWLSSENTSVEAARFACTFPLNAGLTNSCWVVVPQQRRPAFPLALEASEA